MRLKEPVLVYTATTNIVAYLVVDMLEANGIAAHVVEDHSNVGIWLFGTIRHLHKPQVWVEKWSAAEAARLLIEWEDQNRERAQAEESTGDLAVECEECGKTSMFQHSLKGTVQQCSHCLAYVDVGELDWDGDFGTPEDDVQSGATSDDDDG